MLVSDVMSTHVVAVRKHGTFKDIAARLREQRVSAFPVLDDDEKVIGVVSEADLLTKAALDDRMPPVFPGMTRARDEAKAAGVTAADLMTAPPVTVGPDDSVAHAARLMYDRRVKRLPVVDADGRLIGIVARSDVLSVYDRPDEEIRREIIRDVIGEALQRRPGSHHGHRQEWRRHPGRHAGHRRRVPRHRGRRPPRPGGGRGPGPAHLPRGCPNPFRLTDHGGSPAPAYCVLTRRPVMVSARSAAPGPLREGTQRCGSKWRDRVPGGDSEG